MNAAWSTEAAEPYWAAYTFAAAAGEPLVGAAKAWAAASKAQSIRETGAFARRAAGADTKTSCDLPRRGGRFSETQTGLTTISRRRPRPK